MRYIDDLLNKITMYRLLLYFLIILVVFGGIFSVVGILPFNVIDLTFSVGFILFVSYVANKIFAYAFNAPTNVESVYISALILALIMAPPKQLYDIVNLGWAALLTIASKYILAIGKKHIFNPVAVGVAITALTLNYSANWWVGSSSMFPVVLVGGYLIARKIKREDLVIAFLVVALATIGILSFINGNNPLITLEKALMDTPLFFFAFIMLTEPLTSPPTRNLRIIYGALVGFLFAPQVHIASFFTTPEIALVIGNIYSYIVSPKLKLMLKLKSKTQLTPDTYDFVFYLAKPINFTPGQYMEFTFPHPSTDSRGNRRYLSLASSPTEQELRLGIKFGNPPSSFKRNLLTLSSDQMITAGQLIGDFTLPKNPNKKLVFIAGGIGITPFRSIIKYLTDTNQRRDIVVLYSASTPDDFVYKDVLEAADKKLGIKTIYVDTKTQGHMEAARLSKEIPDYKDRMFYISGSHGVVVAFEDVLKNLGVPKNQTITDYFPGFA